MSTKLVNLLINFNYLYHVNGFVRIILYANTLRTDVYVHVKAGAHSVRYNADNLVEYVKCKSPRHVFGTRKINIKLGILMIVGP